MQESLAEVKPGVDWQPLDNEKKVWGPKAVKDIIDEELKAQVWIYVSQMPWIKKRKLKVCWGMWL